MDERRRSVQVQMAQLSRRAKLLQRSLTVFYLAAGISVISILVSAAREAEDEDVYVWWGKIRSPNRQQPMPHLDEILAAARTCFARLGYEGATVRRLEEATALAADVVALRVREHECGQPRDPEPGQLCSDAPLELVPARRGSPEAAMDVPAELAQELGSDTVAHGCTAAGNDQVRFEIVLKTVAPQLTEDFHTLMGWADAERRCRRRRRDQRADGCGVFRRHDRRPAERRARRGSAGAAQGLHHRRAADRGSARSGCGGGAADRPSAR